jgi:hypothetical protein
MIGVKASTYIPRLVTERPAAQVVGRKLVVPHPFDEAGKVGGNRRTDLLCASRTTGTNKSRSADGDADAQPRRMMRLPPACV